MAIGEARVAVEGAFESDGSIDASFDGRRAHAHVIALRDELVVLQRGRSFTLKPHAALETAEHAGHETADVRAPMPGKVVQILVKPGDRVRRGQALAIIEAMKMEHTLASPGDLTVKAAPFRAGDQVSEGAIIVSFDEG